MRSRGFSLKGRVLSPARVEQEMMLLLQSNAQGRMCCSVSSGVYISLVNNCGFKSEVLKIFFYYVDDFFFPNGYSVVRI